MVSARDVENPEDARLGRIPIRLSGRVPDVPPSHWDNQADAAGDHPPPPAGKK